MLALRQRHKQALGSLVLWGLLLRFTKLPPSVNEKNYHLEQLRALDNDIPIRMLLTDYVSHGVDTPADLELIAEIIGL